MMKSKNKQGFTLLEVMMVTTIIGILAAASTYIIGNFVKDKRSEQYVVALWSELCSLRARAIKDNCPYIVQFNTTNGTYQIFKNNLGDYNTANTSSTPISSSFGASGKIAFGNATSPGSANFPTPSPNPLNINPASTATASCIQGQWSQNIITAVTPNATLTNSIVFEANAIGTISNGIIILKNTSVRTGAYIIAKLPNSNTIKLYKWDGSKWYEM